jgi:hypothetical protein
MTRDSRKYQSQPQTKPQFRDIDRLDDNDDDGGDYYRGSKPEIRSRPNLSKGVNDIQQNDDEELYESRMSQNSGNPYSQRQAPIQSRESYGSQKLRRSPPQEARHYSNQANEPYGNQSKVQDNRPPSRQYEKSNDQFNGPKYNSYMKEDPVPSKQVQQPRRDFSKQSEPTRVAPKNPQYLKNENVISAILALIKDLNVSELEFVKKEVNLRIGRLSLTDR